MITLSTQMMTALAMERQMINSKKKKKKGLFSKCFEFLQITESKTKSKLGAKMNTTLF